MSENIYYERIKYAFKMQEDVYLSDLIFPDATPEFRNMFDTFSAEAVIELGKLLAGIYKLEISHYLEFFKEYCIDNYIHPVEVLALKNDIIAFTDDKAKNLTRQFARLNRIKIIDMNSEEFDYRKFNRFVLAGGNKLMIGIDKRFKYNDLKKYFVHLGENFYEFKPQNVNIYAKNN